MSARNETIQKLREELEEIKTGTVTLRLPEHLTLTLLRPLTPRTLHLHPFSCAPSGERDQGA